MNEIQGWHMEKEHFSARERDPRLLEGLYMILECKGTVRLYCSLYRVGYLSNDVIFHDFRLPKQARAISVSVDMIRWMRKK